VGAIDFRICLFGKWLRLEGLLYGFPFDRRNDFEQILPTKMKSTLLASGLTRRTVNCLTKAGIPIERAAIIAALENGSLHPAWRPRNYGRITHKEVCKWAGIGLKFSQKTANCLRSAGIPLEKDAIIRALNSGRLYPRIRPHLYGRNTHFEVCHWVGVDPWDFISIAEFEDASCTDGVESKQLTSPLDCLKMP